MTARRVSIPVADPVKAAVVICQAMRPEAIEVLVALLLGTPDLSEVDL